ncbi:hypothetical protein DV515_00015883, partial [Chloebia gouldiae]
MYNSSFSTYAPLTLNSLKLNIPIPRIGIFILELCAPLGIYIPELCALQEWGQSLEVFHGHVLQKFKYSQLPETTQGGRAENQGHTLGAGNKPGSNKPFKLAGRKSNPRQDKYAEIQVITWCNVSLPKASPGDELGAEVRNAILAKAKANICVFRLWDAAAASRQGWQWKGGIWEGKEAEQPGAEEGADLGHGLLGDGAGPALAPVHALLHGEAAP